MPQTVVGIYSTDPVHQRFQLYTTSRTVKRETRQETRIKQQHIRWDVGTAGLVVPNEPQQSCGCLLFVADSVLTERFEHHK